MTSAKGGFGGATTSRAPTGQRWGTGWFLPAAAAVLFLGGNQWLAHGAVAIGCWVLAGLALLLWGVSLLPPQPEEPSGVLWAD